VTMLLLIVELHEASAANRRHLAQHKIKQYNTYCDVYHVFARYEVHVVRGERAIDFQIPRIPSPTEDYADRYAWLHPKIIAEMGREYFTVKHEAAQFATETILTHSFFHL